MIKHYRYECSQPRFFKCAYCGKLTMQKGNIQDHIRRMHPNHPYKWEICLKDSDS